VHQTGESLALYREGDKINLSQDPAEFRDVRLTQQPMGGGFAN
jgi:hypothetical protein